MNKPKKSKTSGLGSGLSGLLGKQSEKSAFSTIVTILKNIT